MQQQTTTVTINGADYQIGQFKACDGSWILAQVLTKMLPAVIEGAMQKAAGGQLAANRTMISEEEFRNIQGHALAVCRRMENGIPMPVFVLPGTFAVKELEYDLLTVMALTVHALKFNLVPFLHGGGLALILNMLPQVPESNSPPSQT